jgi:hypothetical protein
MTALGATYAYEDASSARLGKGAQRVLMALLMLALIQMLLLPNLLLNTLTGYSNPGGNPLLKIHFYSYTLALAALYVVACAGLIRFFSTQIIERPGVVQFAAVVMLCAVVTIARQGIGGVAYMVDTLLAAPLVIMLASYLDAEKRQKLTALIICFITFNAAIGIAERVAGINLLYFLELKDAEYFRATALMGHPLDNAFAATFAMFLSLAMPWSAGRKLVVLAVCTLGILSFGARSSFAITLILGAVAALYFGIRSLARGDMKLSTLVAAPWIATLGLAVGTALTFGTVLGERIVGLAKLDDSAQTRLDVFKFFDHLSTSDLLYGVDVAEINFLITVYQDVPIIENCWIGILLMLGAVLFVVFAISLAGFLRSIARGRGAVGAFAVLAFLLVASTSNSISTKSPSLALFAIALAGLPLVRPRRPYPQVREPVRYMVPVSDGAWS